MRDIYLRTGIILVLTGSGSRSPPASSARGSRTRSPRRAKGSKWGGGKLGIWLFYGAAYGAIYYAYLVIERRGPAALLPPSLR